MGLSPSKDKEDLVFKASEESQLLDFVDSLKMGQRIWFEQQQIHHVQNEEFREVAFANDYDNFKMFFEPKIQGD